MRELVSQYNFHSITPRQLAELGSALFARHELSPEATVSFVGVENNLEVQLDREQPIDAVAHFDHMLRVAQQAHATESGFEHAVEYRELASRALRDVMSFATSDRTHIRDAST